MSSIGVLLKSALNITKVLTNIFKFKQQKKKKRNNSTYGLNCVAQIYQIQINDPLINALVEQWRLETHTFHLPCGECTVTLKDVAILLGLRIHGLPIIGSTNPNTIALEDMCKKLLGYRPGAYDIDESEIKSKWLTHILVGFLLILTLRQQTCSWIYTISARAHSNGEQEHFSGPWKILAIVGQSK